MVDLPTCPPSVLEACKQAIAAMSTCGRSRGAIVACASFFVFRWIFLLFFFHLGRARGEGAGSPARGQREISNTGGAKLPSLYLVTQRYMHKYYSWSGECPLLAPLFSSSNEQAVVKSKQKTGTLVKQVLEAGAAACLASSSPARHYTQMYPILLPIRS